MKCPKCGYASGDDWLQCNGGCPMPGSPHYSLDADSRANVGTYDDWFPDVADDGWISLGGYVDPPPAPAGFTTQVKYDSYMGFVTDYRLVRAA